jgi:hypothetical protein
MHTLNKLLDEYGSKSVSDKLNFYSGALTRRKELLKLPQSYEFDLLKLSHYKIDYSLYTSRQK